MKERILKLLNKIVKVTKIQNLQNLLMKASNFLIKIVLKVEKASIANQRLKSSFNS